MPRVILSWSGPFSLHKKNRRSIFTAQVANKAGIYVWAVSTDLGRLVYYVGETGVGFAYRHRDHLRSYCTGSYSIHVASALQAGRLECAYHGYVYNRKLRELRYPDFAARRLDLETELSRCFDVLEVYVAPWEGEQRVRRRLETGLLDSVIAAGAGVVGFEDEGWSRWPRRHDEEVLQVDNKPPLPVRDLPSVFQA